MPMNEALGAHFALNNAKVYSIEFPLTPLTLPSPSEAQHQKLVGTAFLPGIISSNDYTVFSRTEERMLKVDGYYHHSHRHEGAVNLDDYRPVDPSPSSKAVKPGPIPHATPLIPYIPRLSPPDSPR
ncbi:hypothetical protein V2J09_007122 [Rumex salicifolius]